MSIDKGYRIRNKEGIYFITFAVTGWVDVFTRKVYRDIVVDSLKFCQKEKGLILHAWCIMSNHIHLILSSEKFNLSNVLRDFKKFTSKQILETIQLDYGESRREWMLDLFRMAGTAKSRNSVYQFWRQDKHPIELYSAKFTSQKLNYIHANPVVAGIVDQEEDYLYSSSRDYHSGKSVGMLQLELLE